MPIRPDLRRLHPADWKQINLRIKGECAGWKCERCIVVHDAWDWRDKGGHFHAVEWSTFAEVPGLRTPFTWRTEDGRSRRIIRIILTTARLDQNPVNNAEENLSALCQRRHLHHDRDQHRRNAAATIRPRMNTIDIFEEYLPRILCHA